MKRGSWLLAAVSCAGAVWSAASADDFRLRPSLWGKDPASKKASEYFSRSRDGEKTDSAKADPAAEKAAASKPARPQTGESTLPATGQYDPRLRAKTPATPPAPPAASTVSRASTFPPDEDEIPFASSEPLAAPQPHHATKRAAAFEENPFESSDRPAARTPSGAPLSRSLSDKEAASTVKDASHSKSDAVPDAGVVQPTTATDENPFESSAARAPRRPAPSPVRPGSRADVKPLLAKPSAPPATERTPSGVAGSTRPSALPAASQGAPQVTARWVKKSEINVGQECEFELVVKNDSTAAAYEVRVDAHLPASVRVTKAVPQPSEASDHLAWSFATLDAGKEEVIRVSLIPSQRGELATTAHVRFTGASSGVFQVDEPLLAVQVKGPKEVLVGDPASHIIVVSNPGTGSLHNVMVEATIPKGLEHPRGERLSMEVGTLGPGESRTVRLGLSAVAGGSHQVKVVAKSGSSLEQAAVSDIVIVAPSMKLALDGPSLRYVGRNATYALTIQNDGAAPSNNVRVMHKIPEGFQFVRADKGGKHDESNQTVSWFVGRLEPGQSVPVKVELTPTKLGSFVHRAGVVSEQGGRAEADCETVVDGTAALQLEIVELADPVEVGAETAYEVRLKNAGSKAAQNVGISCELASSVQLVSAKGPSEHLTENGLVVFKSLATLPAGQTVSYHVHVKGKAEGNHRFRVRLASESITEPLISEELTKFYGE